MRPPRLRARLTAACVAAAACSGLGPDGDCTLIGCSSGLEVQLPSVPAGPYRVEAFVREGGSRYVLECPGAAECGGRAFFADFTPEAVQVRGTTPAGLVTQSFRPSYTAHRPNGADCPPVCRTATVQMPVPG